MSAVDYAILVATAFRETGRLELPEGSREPLTQLLETLIADEDALLCYTAMELRPSLKQARLDYTLNPGEEQAVLDRQWKLLPDATIAALLVLPTELDRIGSRIEEELPYPWLPVIHKINQRTFEALEVQAEADDLIQQRLEPASRQSAVGASTQLSFAASTEDAEYSISEDGRFRFTLENDGVETIVRVQGFIAPPDGVPFVVIIEIDNENAQQTLSPLDKNGRARVPTAELNSVSAGAARLDIRVK